MLQQTLVNSNGELKVMTASLIKIHSDWRGRGTANSDGKERVETFSKLALISIVLGKWLSCFSSQ